MNKDEPKQYNMALTYHYLTDQANGDEMADEMGKRLETAYKKDDDLADMLVVSGNDFNYDTGEKMTSTRTLSAINIGRTWKQCAVIIFIFLHPRIGKQNLLFTCSLTEVKEQTLSGWLCQKKMIQMWVDLVEDMTAEVAIRS
jgi:hypothetical protein